MLQIDIHQFKTHVLTKFNLRLNNEIRWWEGFSLPFEPVIVKDMFPKGKKKNPT